MTALLHATRELIEKKGTLEAKLTDCVAVALGAKKDFFVFGLNFQLALLKLVAFPLVSELHGWSEMWRVVQGRSYRNIVSLSACQAMKQQHDWCMRTAR